MSSIDIDFRWKSIRIGLSIVIDYQSFFIGNYFCKFLQDKDWHNVFSKVLLSHSIVDVQCKYQHVVLQNLTPWSVLEMEREEDNIYDRFALCDERIVGRVLIQLSCLFAKLIEEYHGRITWYDFNVHLSFSEGNLRKHVTWLDNIVLQYSPKIMHAQELLFASARRSSSCGWLQVAWAWVLETARTSLRLNVKSARTSLR